MKTRGSRRAAVLLLAVVSVSGFVSCSKRPIVIGFMGGLTGRLSDLGVSGRNGAQLAVELQNAKGGVRGRRLAFVEADDRQDGGGALAAFDALSSAGASAVVGPMTSDMALAVVDRANAARLLLVSPTASSPKLSGLDDWFVRVNPVDVSEGRALAAYIRDGGSAAVAIALDLANRSFSEGTEATIRTSLGDGISAVRVEFDSKSGVDAPAVARAVAAAAPGDRDCAVVVAASVDAAAISQALRRSGFRGAIYGTGWSMTDDFIRQGGSAAEGTVFSHYFDRDSEAPAWVEFRQEYRKRYGAEPDFIAGLSANAAQVAMDALELNPDPRKLKDTVISMKTFRGLQGEVNFDPYGECDLERFRLEIKGGRLVGSR